MNITENDIAALKAGNKTMYCRAEIIDTDYKTVNMLEGVITSGNYSINSDSDIRRTCNISMCLSNKSQVFTEDIYFNHYVRIHIGYYLFPIKVIKYYCMGIFSFDKESFRYDISSNEVSFTLLDLCSLMDSNHYGTDYGAETSSIYAVDPTTGERLEHSQLILKDIVQGMLKDFSKNNFFEHGGNSKPKINFSKCRIDEIGMNNREGTDEYEWDELPYDLDFSADSGLIDKLSAIRDLYGVHEFFFDTDGTFIFQEIPHTDDDMIILNEAIMSDLVISENMDINIYDIKNVVEVWGKSVNFSRDYREAVSEKYTSSGSDGIYSVTIDNYNESGYSNDIKLALTVNSDNTRENTYININKLGNRIIFDKSTGKPITSNLLKKDKTYIFEYSSNLNSGHGGFYYLSSYQVHAVAIMTDGSALENKDDFVKKYNTENIVFIKDENSRYSIEKIGEVRKKFSGNNYANLESDSLTADYAKAKLTQLCRRGTSLNLEMLIVPWLDVNQKIEYRPHNSSEAKTFITKSINGDLLSGTMSVSLMDFYATLDKEN